MSGIRTFFGLSDSSSNGVEGRFAMEIAQRPIDSFVPPE